MIITLVNCKDKLSTLGVNIDEVGGWDTLRERVSMKVSVLSCFYDCVDNVLTIEVEDGIQIPDMSEFGEVKPNDGT